MCRSDTIRSECKCAQAPTVHLIAQVSAAKSTKAKIIVRPRVRVNSLFAVEAASWPAELSRFSATLALNGAVVAENTVAYKVGVWGSKH